MGKRILYIGNNLSAKGSTVTTIDTLGGFLEQEGYSLRVASSFRNKVLRLIHILWATLLNVKWADKVLIDTYSTQNFIYAEGVAGICRILSMDYVPVLHGGDLPKRLINNPKRVRKLIEGASKVVAPSAYLYNAFAQAGFKNLVHIPNTIDLAQYSFKQRKAVKPKLLWVRSFHSTYNPQLALHVLEGLLESYPEAELCMIGPDKDGSLARCQQMAKLKNLPVSFTGKMEKARWIAHSEGYDLFINTTNFDNTPVSVIEAMALGLPVVSTNVGGMPFLIEDGVDGVLVPPNDAKIFAGAIKNLITNPTKANQMARRAREKVEGFDWQAVKSRWFEILDA